MLFKINIQIFQTKYKLLARRTSLLRRHSGGVQNGMSRKHYLNSITFKSAVMCMLDLPIFQSIKFASLIFNIDNKLKNR